MKSLKNILFISASVLVLSSCTDNLLDREPLNIISDSQVYTDKTLADAKLTQAYTQMCVMINECGTAHLSLMRLLMKVSATG